MEFHKEQYEKLLKRFALELSEVGVTENMLKLVEAVLVRAPNVKSDSESEVVGRFTYRHDGYLIEAKKTVELIIKKCE
tara:strand:- start:1768 stop:2001 length:234 start_codon:yes stop_codon:yes gene_type:complete